MSKPPANLADLPSTAIEKVLRRLNSTDILSLSLCSPRLAEAVRTCHIRAETDIQVRFAGKEVFVVFEATKLVNKSLKIDLDDSVHNSKSLMYSSEYQFHSECQWPGPRKIVFIAKHTAREMEKAIKCAIKHICSVFHRPVSRVTVDVNHHPEPADLFIWDYLKGTCDEVQLGGCKLENSELIRFFQKVDVQKGLAIDVCKIINQPSHMSFPFSAIQHLQLFVFPEAPWFTDEHFHKMNANFLELTNPAVTLKAIKKWLIDWRKETEQHKQVLLFHSDKYVKGGLYVWNGWSCQMVFGTVTMIRKEFGSFFRVFPGVGAPFFGQQYSRERIAALQRADGAEAKIVSGNAYCISMEYPTENKPTSDSEDEDESEEESGDDEDKGQEQ